MNHLHADTPLTVAGVTLISIARVQTSLDTQAYGAWLNATKMPVALVICDPAGPRAVDIEAREVAIESLLAAVPELETLLAGCYEGES
jgi:hypothetical protein